MDIIGIRNKFLSERHTSLPVNVYSNRYTYWLEHQLEAALKIKESAKPDVQQLKAEIALCLDMLIKSYSEDAGLFCDACDKLRQLSAI